MPRKSKLKPIARARGKLAERIEEVAMIPTAEAPDQLRRPAKPVFEAYAAEDNSEAVIDIYDVIGTWDLNAATFRRLLNSITAPRITIRINSPGGSVFDAFAMYDDLRSHGAHVHVHIAGLAASAASLIAMAGDTISIADNGFIMVHEAWVAMYGNKRELASAQRLLGQIDRRLASTYQARAGGKVADWAAAMEAETWYDAEDAVAAGLADDIGAAVPVASLAHDYSCFQGTPAVLKKARGAAENPTVPEQIATPADVDDAEIVAALARLADALK